MDGLAWRKWLSGLLLLLLIAAVAWGVLRWSDSNAQSRSPLPGVTSLKLSYQVMRDKPGSVGGSWLRTLNPFMKNVQGDLVWSNVEQKGVMRFLNLPDPKKGFLYHLWIYDSRTQEGEVSNQPVLAATMRKGSGQQERFVPLVIADVVEEPFKFVLTMAAITEGAGHPEDSAIMLMVQP